MQFGSRAVLNTSFFSYHRPSGESNILLPFFGDRLINALAIPDKSRSISVMAPHLCSFRRLRLVYFPLAG
jgi:hypothetical protein